MNTVQQHRFQPQGLRQLRVIVRSHGEDVLNEPIHWAAKHLFHGPENPWHLKEESAPHSFEALPWAATPTYHQVHTIANAGTTSRLHPT